MRLISSGKPYQVGFNRYEEGVHYQFDKDGHNIHIFIESPTEEEVKAIAADTMEWKLLTFPDALFILFKFETLGWFDVPYAWSIAPLDRRAHPSELSQAQIESVAIMLINATNGLVVDSRIVTPEPHSFIQSLNEAILNQTNQTISYEQYSQRINAIYQAYPSPSAMLSILQENSCKEGYNYSNLECDEIF